MKKGFFLIMCTLVMAAPYSKAQGIMAKWPELHAFHQVMSQTFHPAEEGNLQPIKTRSGEMVKKAKELAASKVPQEFNKPDILEAVKQLVTDSEKLDKMISNGKTSDAEITKALSALHDVFHKIIGLCKEEKH